MQYEEFEIRHVRQDTLQYWQILLTIAIPEQLLTQVDPSRYNPEVQVRQLVVPGPKQVRQGAEHATQ